MAKDKQYLIFKNFVHNELGVTKENFEKLMTEAIKTEAKAFVQRRFQQKENDFIKIVEDSVKKEVFDNISGRSWSSGKDALFKGIGEQIAKSLKLEK